ncbi:MAG: fibronectin type III domain-containing protein, partial [Thermoguttaceae bacterium]|nr:fibronectin type III domain-containing protein [Thermoguttaceae bacterium]
LSDLATNATSRVCGGLEIGNVYQYRLRAVAADGTASEWVSATITPTVVPAAPTNVKFGAYDSTNKRATLTWTDNATNEVRYEIQSSTNGGEWKSLSSLAANTTSRVCSGLQAGTTYSYRIRAVNADGVASNWGSATIAPPAAPTNVKFGAYDATNKRATLSWTDNATNEVRYEIQSSTNGGEWKSLSNLAANTTSRVCSGLQAGTTYSYRIRAVNADGVASNWVSATIVTTVKLTAPSSLTMVGYNSTLKRATLAWVDMEAKETGYEVQSSTNGGSWQNLPTLSANSSSRACAGLELGNVYKYRVRAICAGGFSDWVEITFDASGKLDAPIGLTMIGYNPTIGKATLAWVDVAEGETKYEVQSSTNGGKSWNRLTDLSANSTSRSCAGLTAGQTFIYRIRAVSDTKVSDWASIMFYAPPATSSAVLASEVFATPFDESDFFADEDEFDVWARVRS